MYMIVLTYWQHTEWLTLINTKSKWLCYALNIIYADVLEMQESVGLFRYNSWSIRGYMNVDHEIVLTLNMQGEWVISV